MREIKVRGYAVEEMIDSQWIYGTGVHKTTFTDEYAKETGKKYEYLIWTEMGWVEVLGESIGQYTGLKDKNGKEIYEGDILQAFDREDFRMQIVYREPSFCIKWFDETIKSVRQTRDGAEPIPHNIHVTSVVIGNIYENPKLLEQHHD